MIVHPELEGTKVFRSVSPKVDVHEKGCDTPVVASPSIFQAPNASGFNTWTVPTGANPLPTTTPVSLIPVAEADTQLSRSPKSRIVPSKKKACVPEMPTARPDEFTDVDTLVSLKVPRSSVWPFEKMAA